MRASEGVVYPITQIPPSRDRLPGFGWYDYVRPLNKDDIFEWRGKGDGNKLKTTTRRSAPLQTLRQNASPQATDSESDTQGKTSGETSEEVTGDTQQGTSGDTPEKSAEVTPEARGADTDTGNSVPEAPK